MTHKEVITALRSTPIRSKRELLDTDLTQFERFVARYERNMHKPWNKPKTNADLIRSMSDEKLAEFLRWDICTKVRGDNRLCNGWCDECVAEWLQQPANEVASDVLMRPDGEEDA